MFDIQQPDTFTWPVEVWIPRDGGKKVKATFTAEFKALDQDEIDNNLRDLRDGNPDADFATGCLVGWKGLQDGGTELPFSDEAKVKALRKPYVRNAIVTAFFESISGKSAARKNL